MSYDEWTVEEPNSAPNPKIKIINTVNNITVNIDTVPTGFYDTQGCCTEHHAPCAHIGVTCQPKE